MRIEKQNPAVLLGIDHDAELVFPETLSHEHDYETELKHSADDHAFIYKETEIQAQVSSLEAEKRKRALWPKLEAYATYAWVGEREVSRSLCQEDRRETALGLRLSLPLADGYEALELSRTGGEPTPPRGIEALRDLWVPPVLSGPRLG